MLSRVVMNCELREPGQPIPSPLPPGPAQLTPTYDTPSIVLALSTLGTFNFEGEYSNNFYILLNFFVSFIKYIQ